MRASKSDFREVRGVQPPSPQTLRAWTSSGFRNPAPFFFASNHAGDRVARWRTPRTSNSNSARVLSPSPASLERTVDSVRVPRGEPYSA